MLGSSLVKDFNTIEGRKKTAFALLSYKINKLVVISMLCAWCHVINPLQVEN